ncbi:serine protease HTRA3 [Hydra vulgaris]|uniref:serine protease HTRA3 n=1 Tax=Hydra vulgaris TaxID=6087 RepID=UPI000192742F|nr:serine protease HTRA3 [Hydra vulgaris]
MYALKKSFLLCIFTIGCVVVLATTENEYKKAACPSKCSPAACPGNSYSDKCGCVKCASNRGGSCGGAENAPCNYGLRCVNNVCAPEVEEDDNVLRKLKKLFRL